MKKAIDSLQRIQIFFGGSLLAIFLIIMVFQMFTRFAGISVTWTEDVTKYTFAWAVFMGASAMVHEKGHFAFTSFGDKLKNKRAKSILSIIIAFIMLFFAILLIYYGYHVTKQFWNYTWINIPQFKRGPIWLCIPIAGVTSAIYLINQIITDAKFLLEGGNK